MACVRLEQGWASFNYLAGSETFSLGEVDDGEAFRDTMDAMTTVGLTQLVSALAHRQRHHHSSAAAAGASYCEPVCMETCDFLQFFSCLTMSQDLKA